MSRRDAFDLVNLLNTSAVADAARNIEKLTAAHLQHQEEQARLRHAVFTLETRVKEVEIAHGLIPALWARDFLDRTQSGQQLAARLDQLQDKRELMTIVERLRAVSSRMSEEAHQQARELKMQTQQIAATNGAIQRIRPRPHWSGYIAGFLLFTCALPIFVPIPPEPGREEFTFVQQFFCFGVNLIPVALWLYWAFRRYPASQSRKLAELMQQQERVESSIRSNPLAVELGVAVTRQESPPQLLIADPTGFFWTT